MKLNIGISPCPNDTFIFDALFHGKIDTAGFEFNYILEDVESLNNMALQGKLDVSKVSYGVVPHLLKQYALMDAGGALGSGVGPLFVSKKYNDETLLPEKISVALPGVNTTAHLLFSLAYPQMQNKSFMPFHEIENAIIEGKVDAGVIIHENRFTFRDKGLQSICDLGEVWEKNTGMPIPLGGIVAKRTLGIETINILERLIQKSLSYAFKHSETLPPFVIDNAQEMHPDVMRKHIGLYVNSYSMQLGDKGRLAVLQLLQSARTEDKRSEINFENVFIKKDQNNP